MRKTCVLGVLMFGVFSARVDAASVDELDKATSIPEWRAAENHLKADPSARAELKRYAYDETKDGQKRFKALQIYVDTLPESQRWTEIAAALGKTKNKDFRFSAVLNASHYKDPAVSSFLRGRIADAGEDHCLRLAAGSALADGGDTSGKNEALNAILNGKECTDFAIQTLATLRASDTIPRLRAEMNKNGDSLIRDNANEAILRIQMQGKSLSAQQKLAEVALKDDRFERVQKWAGCHPSRT